MKRVNAIERLDSKLDSSAQAGPVTAGSLKEFLLTHARVKTSGGAYVPYGFEGRPVLEHIVDRFDMILGNHGDEPLTDATFDICGGAQWGKTIFALNFGVYLTSCKFYNWGYYLPDDDLVQGIVDTKLRPDVVEQIDGLAGMMELGATVDKRGRKVVNRKGAFMVTDGTRKAFAMIRGMGKIPTSFSMDCAMEDEKDDIPERMAKFLTGRMTASDLRLSSSIGTQRKHGKGQHAKFMAGTQEVQMFRVPGTDRLVNIEESWPQVCRLAVDGTPKPTDPQLTYAGNFKDGAGQVWDYDPSGVFYVADPETGAPLDRNKPVFVERRPERAKLRKWSIRVAQVAVAAISLSQPVSRWQDAVRDPESMEVFYCDVLALPKNSSQALTPEIITRARSIEQPFDLRLSLKPGCKSFAGVDTGNRCWFFAREVESEWVKRSLWAEQIPLGDLVRRVVHLARTLDVGCLMVDAHPAVDQARAIAYALNNLEDIQWPEIKDPDKTRIVFPGGLTWDGPNSRWENLRAAVVQFTKGSGSGTTQKIGKEEEGGRTKYYPIIQVSRFDLINRAVNEFLGPKEQVSRVRDGKVVEEPVMRLCQKVPGSPAIVETLEAHLVTGSEKDAKGDFVDECENHLLLADGYSALAEHLGQAGFESTKFMFPPRRGGRRTSNPERSVC
ncbi:MAG: hypothetical protein RLZ97_387 [Verrucomicrobiota bacterium]